MSNTKHTPTPGPWKAVTTPAGKWKAVDSNGFSIATTPNYGNEAQANAELIASAPTLYQQNQSLLEALKECEEYFDDKADVAEGFYPTPNKEMKLLTMIRETIKKTEI